MKHLVKHILPLFLAAVFSASCGSSGDGTTTASGGIGGTGISQGTIDGFGSIIRDEDTFNTDDAIFTIDDKVGSQSALRIGQVVKILVDDSGTKATKVEYEAEVEGPIDSTDDATKTIVVLGKTVIVDDSTVIEGSAGNTLTFALLVKDNMIEVSGLVFSDDKIQATHIKKKTDVFAPNDTEVELKGTVLAPDKDLKTFTIGSQQVNYTVTTTFEKMEEADLAMGLFVEVKGTRGAAAGSPITATTIQKEDGVLGANANDNVEIEGLVSEFLSIGAFKVNGQAVDASSAIFEDGASDDVANNVRLEVEGAMNANGVLVAKKVKFHGNRIKIEANVEGKSTSGPNAVTLLGKAVLINGATGMKDTLVFSDIKKGDRLEIRGFLSGGLVTATRVERNNDKIEDDVRLQAPVEADPGAGPNLTLLEVIVDTTGAKFFDSRGDIEPEPEMTRSDFFLQVTKGSVVKVKGRLSGADIIAEEVEFED